MEEFENKWRHYLNYREFLMQLPISSLFLQNSAAITRSYPAVNGELYSSLFRYYTKHGSLRPMPVSDLLKNPFQTKDTEVTTKETNVNLHSIGSRTAGDLKRRSYEVTEEEKWDRKRRLQCTFCWKILADSKSLGDHERLRHTGEKPLKCRFCDEQFSTHSRRWRHQQKCHGVISSQGKIVRPLDMGRATRDNDIKELMERSQKTQITQDTVINPELSSSEVCEPQSKVKTENGNQNRKNQTEEECDKSLVIHVEEREIFLKCMKNMKRNVKGYRCILCNKSFVRPSQAFRHSRLHNPDRSYKCPDCNETFRILGTLKIHQERRSHCNNLMEN